MNIPTALPAWPSNVIIKSEKAVFFGHIRAGDAIAHGD